MSRKAEKSLQKSPVRRGCQGVDAEPLLDRVVSVSQGMLVDVQAFWYFDNQVFQLYNGIIIK